MIGFWLALVVVLAMGAAAGSLDLWLYEAPMAEERRRRFHRLWKRLTGGMR